MFLDVRPDVKFPIRKSEQGVLRLDGVRSEQHTVVAGNFFAFLWSGKVEVCSFRHAHRMAKTGSIARTKKLGSSHEHIP